MILHIFESNGIFVNTAIKCFDNLGNVNHYIVIGKKKELDEKNDNGNITYINSLNRKTRKQINAEVGKYNLILFHGLFGKSINILKSIRTSKNVKIGWIIYGTELAFNRLNPHYYLQPKTKLIYYKTGPYRIILPVYRYFIRLLKRDLYSLQSKVDYVFHFMPQEIEIAEQLFHRNFSKLWFTYVLMEDFVGNDFLDSRCEKNGNILIGNSSSFSSNHADIFYKLKDSDYLNKTTVYVPLSYGNKIYANHVAKVGKKILGNSFLPLTKFIAQKEYHKILLSCSCVIMNHNRQQALGNIIVALWLGSKVYLKEGTSTFQYFKNLGIYIYSIENDLDSHNQNSFESLSDEQLITNREILMKVFGKETYLHNISSSFNQFI
ncbi:hypothetical protein CYCD_27050 [Tenuifilaceae bacterium CYCD]|nr:hypothetical protein CYCD_27050 [Tenuifilaceae bacterium CYCD]